MSESKEQTCDGFYSDNLTAPNQNACDHKDLAAGYAAAGGALGFIKDVVEGVGKVIQEVKTYTPDFQISKPAHQAAEYAGPAGKIMEKGQQFFEGVSSYHNELAKGKSPLESGMATVATIAIDTVAFELQWGIPAKIGGFYGSIVGAGSGLFAGPGGVGAGAAVGGLLGTAGGLALANAVYSATGLDVTFDTTRAQVKEWSHDKIHGLFDEAPVTSAISFKEFKDYYGVSGNFAPQAPATPTSSIASMLDHCGIAPSVGMVDAVNVGSLSVPSVPSYESPLGIAASLETAGKGLGMGLGPSLANSAMPGMSMEAAMGLQAAQAQQAAAAAAAAKADMLSVTNSQTAMLNALEYASHHRAEAVGVFDEKAFAAAMAQNMVSTMVNTAISAVGLTMPGIGPMAAYAGLMSPQEAAPDAPAPTAATTQYGMIEAAFTSVDANGFAALDNGALRDFMNQTAPTPGQAFGNTGMTVIEAMQVARENQNGKGSSASGSASGNATTEGEATETSSGPAGPGGNPYADREAAAQGKSSNESGPSSGTSSTSGNDTGGGPEGGEGDGDSGSEGGSGNDGGGGSYAPVVLDLDGDGVELVDASGGAQYDTNDDGTRERLGWAGKDDGLLAIDLDGDGKITGAKELSFAMHTAEKGDTDLQGLAKVFDSNKDGVLDAQDNEFSKFRIWQDKDGDGVSDKGEVKTLAEMGIKSIGVVSDGKSYTQAGNTVHGTASYTKTDGTTRSVGDVDFKIAGKGSKPTAPNNVGDDEDGDDEDFDRGARQALTGKISTRLPEMSTSGGAIAMAAAMRIAAVEAATNYARAA